MNNLDMAAFNDAVIVVTGGAGFVGSNLVRHLLGSSSPQSIWVIDNFLSSEPENLPVDSRVKVLVGSAADERVLNRLPTHLDYVFHLACYHGNQSSIHDPLADHDNNSYPSLVLFDFLNKKSHLKKVVYSAAGCAVAQKTLEEPAATSEDASVSLFHDSPYSISKLVGEMYGNYYFSQYGLPFVKARFQNVYGPGEILGAGQWRGTSHTIWRNVIPTFVWNAISNEPIPLENKGAGSRDFIFVGDVVDGLCRCALLGKEGENYNLGSGRETLILELARSIIELSDSQSELQFLQGSRSWDRSGRRFADTRKSCSEIGFVANTGIDEGLFATIEWTQENRDKISASIFKHHQQFLSAKESEGAPDVLGH